MAAALATQAGTEIERRGRAGFASLELPIALVCLALLVISIHFVAGWLGAPTLSWPTWLGIGFGIPVALLIGFGVLQVRREAIAFDASVAQPRTTGSEDVGIWETTVRIESETKEDCLRLSNLIDPAELTGDRLISAGLETGSFSGVARDVNLERPAIQRFLRELTQLEASRQGSATLTSSDFQDSSTGLLFELRVIDQLGHVSIRAELKESVQEAEGWGCDAVQATFAIDPSTLPTLLRKLQGLLAS